MGSPLSLPSSLLLVISLAGAVCAAPIKHLHEELLSGEACVAMGARAAGHAINPSDVFHAAKVDPALGRGANAAELRRGMLALGIEPGSAVSDPVVAWRGLCVDLGAKVPSVVYLAAAGRDPARWLLVGAQVEAGLRVHDPVSPRGGVTLSEASFRKRWAKAGCVRLACRIERARPAPKISERPTPAAYARHIHGLRARLPHPRFTIVLTRPFVVLGDEAPATVRRRAKATVAWAVKRLKALYFSKNPDHVIDVWLFKDRASYLKHAKELFNDEPDTPYGYYSPTDKALVMNIATGGGTLVHEIVHPFMHANFPGCPSWFNEGLASLYEQCGDRKGRINGFVNWRLKGLLSSIRDKELRSFPSLLATTSREFYGRGSGSHYAQARYLCYYLQERGLLVKFFRRFTKTQAKDPGGVAALKAVLETKDLKAFQRRWEEWVLKLR
jgi:hypothetical protein